MYWTKNYDWQTFTNNQGNQIHLPFRVYLENGGPKFPQSKAFDRFIASFDIREIGPKPQNPKPGARRGKFGFVYFRNIEMLTFFKLAYGEIIGFEQHRSHNGVISDG